MKMRDALLIIGSFINLISIVPYLIDIVRGKTKPNVVSWFTWTILTGIGTAAVIAQAGFGPAILPLSASICTFSVVLLGLKYGFAKYSKVDAICQVCALGGVILWIVFNSPHIALVAAISIDAIAGIPTLLHAYKAPQEETWQTFMLGSIGALLTLASASSFTTAKVAYPIYLAIANGAIAGTMVVMRLRKGISLSRKVVA
jgi:hypothetical protein